MNEQPINDADVQANPQAFLDAYIHFALSEHQQRIVEQWIDANPKNRAALDEAKLMTEELESANQSANEKLDEQLVEKTMRHFELKTRRKKKFWGRYWKVVAVATAASVLALIATQVYYSRLTPPDFDLQLIGQSRLLADSDSILNIAVVRNSTGEPVEGVPVKIQLSDEHSTIELCSYRTGEDLPAIHWPDWSGKCELTVIAKPDGHEQRIQRSIRLERSFQVMLTSDKPIYQPGQTIHMRSISLRKPDLKPVVDSPAVFRVFDAKGNTVFKKSTSTSKFGICNADFVLASEVNEGSYRVECQIGDTKSEQAVKVSHYALPKFKIAIELDRRFYKPGDTVTGSISANYFFGKPVADGKVEMWNQASGLVADVYFSKPKVAKTDADGMHKFSFRLPSTMVNRGNGFAEVNLVVQVTDAANQSVANSKRIRVTAEPIQIEVIPERSRLLQGIENRVFIYTAYSDGQPARTTVTVNGQTIQTDAMGVAETMVTPNAHEMRWLIKAEDSEGHVGRRRVNLHGEREGDALLLRTDKAVCRSGDTMEIETIGPGNQPVFVDLIQNKQTVLTKTIRHKNGSGNLVVDLPPSVFGLLRIEAYRIVDGKPISHTTRLVQVDKVSDLQIVTEIDNQNPKPGDKTNVTFRVTDSEGNPAPAALGVVAVDEAVYSVANLPFGLESTFFAIEKEFMQPVYAIYGEWSARHFDGERIERDKDRDRKLDGDRLVEDRSQRFEQAMLARAGNAANNIYEFRSIRNSFFEGTADDDSHEAIRPARFHRVHTLKATGFNDVNREFKAKKKRGLSFVRNASWIFGTLLTLCLLTTFAVAKPKLFFKSMAAVGVFLVCVIGFLLMTVEDAQKAFNEIAADISDARSGSVGSEGSMMTKEHAKSGAKSVLDRMLGSDSSKAGSAPPRIRRDFPETLVWRPQLITDDNGEVTLPVQLADSITNWKMAFSAVSTGGKLGAGQADITVFQPFFVDMNAPVELVRGDQVKMPIVVYNYLEMPQTIELEIDNAGWFGEWQEDGEQKDDENAEPIRFSVDIEPGKVESVFLPIRATKVGTHELKIVATSGDAADAIIKSIRVVPDGQLVEVIASGSLAKELVADLSIPENAIPGSEKLLVRIQPATFNQVVDGLDSIFRMPNGCFEQTSSATYPNIMALQYLQQHDVIGSDVELKAREYINIGYQRLLSFEVAGGGFDWYGSPPANTALTAYGLMEFVDMATVHDVDPDLIARTRRWLMRKRDADGSWDPRDRLHHGLQRGNSDDGGRLAITAYVAWSVFGGDATDSSRTTDWLLSHPASTLEDPYTIALVANALLAAEASAEDVQTYLDRLIDLQQIDEAESLAWWGMSQAESDPGTIMHSRGRSADVEATSLAVLALLRAQKNLDSIPQVLNWIMESKDARGNWHSTQATILALKALIAGAGAPTESQQNATVTINIDGELKKQVDISGDQREVTQFVDLSESMKNRAGEQSKFSMLAKLEDENKSASSMCGQVVLQYHVPSKKVDAKQSLTISVKYDTESLQVNETVTADLRVQNNMDRAAPMVMLDLPIPAGFGVLREDFEKMVEDEKIAKFEISSRQIIVYLRNLPAKSEAKDDSSVLNLQYRLEAIMPVKVTVPEAEIYEYYNPENRSRSGRANLEAVEAE